MKRFNPSAWQSRLPFAKEIATALLLSSLSLSAMAECEELDDEVYDTLTEQFDNVDDCQVDGLIVASQKHKADEKWGYIDSEGKIKIPLIYEGAERFDANGLTWVKLNKKFGMIDRQGQVITPIRYDMANETQDGMVAVRQGKQIGYLNAQGKAVIPLDYQYGDDFKDGLAIVGKTDKDGNYQYGFIDKHNTVVVPLIYDYVTEFAKGLAVVGSKKDNVDSSAMQFGYVNRQGKVIVSPQLDDAFDLVEGMGVIKKDGKYGYINAHGKIVISPSYDDVWDFIHGTAVVKQGEKYGVINQKNRLVIPIEYDSLVHGDGYNTFEVEKDGESYVIDQKNKRIVTASSEDY